MQTLTPMLCGVSLCLGLLPGSFARAQVDVQRCIPADTVFVVRAHVDEAMRAAAVEKLIAQRQNQYDSTQAFLFQKAGLDWREIDTIWLLSKQPKSGALIARGRFDQADIRTAFGAWPNVTEIEKPGCLYAGRFTNEKNNTMQLGAILDSSTVAVGDEMTVTSFLDTWQGSAPAVPATNPRLGKLVANKATFVVTNLGDMTAWHHGDESLAGAVTHIWLTGTVGDGIQLAVDLVTDTMERAQGFELMLRGLQLLRTHPNQPANQAPQNPALQRVLANMSCERSDNTLRLAVAATTQDLCELAELRQRETAPAK